MQKKVFQLLTDNTSGVLSRISGLFSRRGYNIESITAGVTSDPRYSRITIVASGDDEILEQIEKQVAKLVDVRNIKELKPDESVYRELVLIKVKAEADKAGVPMDAREFHCRGEFRSLHKGRPNEEDLNAAAAFAKEIVKE